MSTPSTRVQDAQSPIMRMSRQILARIFTYTARGRCFKYKWLVVPLVCRQWHLITTQDTSLWTNIEISEIPSLVFLDRILELSKGALLDISCDYCIQAHLIVGNLNKSQAAAGIARNTSLLGRILPAELPRIKSLHISCGDPKVFSLLSTLSEHDAPHLRTLKLDGESPEAELDDLMIHLRLDKTPALQALQLRNGFQIPLEEVSSFTSLRTLVIDPFFEPPLGRLHDCLQKLQLLETVDLGMEPYPDNEESDEDKDLPVIHMPNVKQFILSRICPTAAALMSIVQLPDTAELLIRPDLEYQDDFEGWLATIRPRFADSEFTKLLHEGALRINCRPRNHDLDLWNTTFAPCPDIREPDAGRIFTVSAYLECEELIMELISSLPTNHIRQLHLLSRPRIRKEDEDAPSIPALAPLMPHVTELRFQGRDLQWPRADITSLKEPVPEAEEASERPWPLLTTLQFEDCEVKPDDVEHLQKTLALRDSHGCAKLSRLGLVRMVVPQQCLETFRTFIAEVVTVNCNV